MLGCTVFDIVKMNKYKIDISSPQLGEAYSTCLSLLPSKKYTGDVDKLHREIIFSKCAKILLLTGLFIIVARLFIVLVLYLQRLSIVANHQHLLMEELTQIRHHSVVQRFTFAKRASDCQARPKEFAILMANGAALPLPATVRQTFQFSHTSNV